MTNRLQAYFAVLSKLNSDGAARAVGNGLTLRCPYLERHKNGDRNPSCRLFVGKRNGALMAKCMACGATWGEIVRATGTNPADWFPSRSDLERDRRMDQRPQEVARYGYRAAGQSRSSDPYAVKVRLEPGYHGERKVFAWERPLPSAWGQIPDLPPGTSVVAIGAGVLDGGLFALAARRPRRWDFRRVADGQSPPDGCPTVAAPLLSPGLFRGETLPDTPRHVPVFVCEGEAKSLVLARLGFCAVSPPHGSNVWLSRWALALAGRPVVVCPDNDAPGMAHADRVAGSLVRAGVRQLRVLEPGKDGFDAPDGGGDVVDWLLPMADDRERREAVVAVCRRRARFEFTKGE